MSEDTIGKLVAAARAGLRAWFADLRDDPSLLAEGHWMHGLDLDRWSQEDAPITDDTAQTPRIELRARDEDAKDDKDDKDDKDSATTKATTRRREVFGMVFAGVPVQHGDKYITSRLTGLLADGAVHGLPTGRLCYDVTVPGLSKVHHTFRE